MTDQKAKGDKLMAEAEQQLTAGGGKCCGGGRVKVAEACELYVKAANAFKMAKEWQSAGNAFSEAAHHELEEGRKTEAGMHYVEAAKCYKKVNPNDCEKSLIKASEVYADVGRGKTAAKQHLTLAELYDEQGNVERARDEYQMAADMFSAEDLTSSTTKCMLNVALHSATLGDYARAEEIFENQGEAALSNKLLKYTACENYTKAGLCRLASNPQDGEALITKTHEWRESSPAFGDSREFGFLNKLAEAIKAEDLDAFNEAVRWYESVTRLGAWENELLKRIRKNVGPDLR
ncbi:alpha-soluble NSF attachment protein-like [Uloborus diversus]|uniref:alpha-soluble NSF attachment protein-like n=1 Tax=Uloborus diversus TaxID=327109 RepID=UPI0024097C93|nr:alpha-soluble NSF attachment protein-like [Uloborus diversus]